MFVSWFSQFPVTLSLQLFIPRQVPRCRCRHTDTTLTAGYPFLPLLHSQLFTAPNGIYLERASLSKTLLLTIYWRVRHLRQVPLPLGFPGSQESGKARFASSRSLLDFLKVATNIINRCITMFVVK